MFRSKELLRIASLGLSTSCQTPRGRRERSSQQAASDSRIKRARQREWRFRKGSAPNVCKTDTIMPGRLGMSQSLEFRGQISPAPHRVISTIAAQLKMFRSVPMPNTAQYPITRCCMVRLGHISSHALSTGCFSSYP